jgi:predicted dehydrogenase
MNAFKIFCFSAICFAFPVTALTQRNSSSPLRIVVAGTSHGHSGWILGKKDTSAVVVVGVYEPDAALAAKQSTRHKIPASRFQTDLKKLLLEQKPEAVVAFGSIHDHLSVVEACAPLGIHVMVEKPLAVSQAHAEKMEALAKKHGIHLLTNYETSWYPTTIKSFQLLHDSTSLGKLKKAVIHDGHQGPREIGVSDEFFNWLTDPIQNGGGALIDFGCYGANLMTYLTKGERPVSVTAVTRQFKPSIYPKVDDDATIIVNYRDAQCIIQASWNWPFSRKDMELYGEHGYAIAVNNNVLRTRYKDGNELTRQITTEETGVYTDPFNYLEAVIRRKITPLPYDLYSLENNMMVVRILEAARVSAATGKTVLFR